MAHYRFNRHQLFSQEDTSEVLDIIRTVDNIALDNESFMEGAFGELTNMLYGLFDGYWYDSLERDLMGTNLPTHMLADLSEVLDRVQDHIKENGQTVTLV